MEVREGIGMPKEEIARAEKWLRENLLAQELLKRSHLNEKTLKALLLHSWSEGATFEDIARRLKIQQPGAWKRWWRGRDAIMRSFYTIELAIYAGVLEAETAEVLVDDLLDYMSLVRGEGNVDELRDRIERRMVQLAKEIKSKK
jgi:uncharacterized protein with PhoU and TrkA domain